jgi:hypothetical protein
MRENAVVLLCLVVLAGLLWFLVVPADECVWFGYTPVSETPMVPWCEPAP